MNSFHMTLHCTTLRELLAANLALVTSFSARSLSVRSVVVSAEGGVVHEHHVTDLTLDTRSPSLKQRRNQSGVTL